MKKSAAVFVCFSCFVLCFHANAIPDSHQEAVEELFQLMNTSGMIESARMQIRRTIFEQLNQREVPDTKKPVLDRTMTKIDSLITEMINWNKIKGDMTALYMNTFTEEEMIDMVIFYKSPTGRAVVKKMPKVMNALTELSQKQFLEMLPQVNRLVEEMEKELEQE